MLGAAGVLEALAEEDTQAQRAMAAQRIEAKQKFWFLDMCW